MTPGLLLYYLILKLPLELFYTSNSSHPNFLSESIIAMDIFAPLLLALSAIEEGEYGINDMIAIILDTLNVLNLPPTPISDSVLTPSISKVIVMPNPFSSQMSFCFETKEPLNSNTDI